jgi:hypothetical protein
MQSRRSPHSNPLPAGGEREPSCRLRCSGGHDRVRVESAAARDGVASLFVGDGDWATAWAGEGGIDPRQRELALRFGVNMVMVALTGNYKADQVHVPALLERMGGERR